MVDVDIERADPIGVTEGVGIDVSMGVVERCASAETRGASVRGPEEPASGSTKPGGKAGPVLPSALACAIAEVGVGG